MKPYEQEVFQEFKQFANVVESWALYDSILICSNFYGGEVGVRGWFTSLQGFGQQETHSFFKTRTEGIAGAQYCNLQSADSLDFAFVADSIGLAIMAPAPNTAGEPSDPDGTAGDLAGADEGISHWFQAELPEHVGIQLKIQQDIRAEIQGMSCPPGYGPIGGGAGFTSQVQPGHGDIPFLTNVVTQGVPLLSNRYPLPQPIGIPRTATIEGILHLSEYARNVLTNVGGPRQFAFNSADGLPPYIFFPQRYVIVLSLFGQRLVQQRAQYHR